MSELLFIGQVLISVFDKSKIVNFAKSLSQYGTQFLSTEGTAQILSDSGISTQKISDYTQFPEIINGRIKTLHHKIYAGVLHRKDLDKKIMNQYNIQAIDMVIINFYPFHSVLKNQTYSQKKILEYIDIGGPSIVRAASKNYKNIAVITDINDYKSILDEIHRNNGSISLNTRLNLASKAFKYIYKYDALISDYFNNLLLKNNKKIDFDYKNNVQEPNYHFPDILDFKKIKFTKKQNVRYGENPHQKAALYIEKNTKQTSGSIANAQQIQGKSLSYNNIIDMDTALECVKTFFNHPTCVIVKHANPCGVATSDTLNIAYHKAYQADPISAFGGAIAFNQPVDKKTAQSIITQNFVESVIAPDFHKDSLDILSIKKNIQVLNVGTWNSQKKLNFDLKRISEGLLIQDYDILTAPTSLNVVTITHPTTKEMEDAIFCWKIVKFVKSNAIVCGKNYQTTGIGAGQMNRVQAVKIATLFNPKNSLNIQGSSMASDAFFTFPDGIHIAAQMGIRCIIQPGGSIKDSEIIKTANQYNISMIFTHTRHFRH